MSRPLVVALLLGAVALVLAAYAIGSAVGLLLSAPPTSSYGVHQLGPITVSTDVCLGTGRGRGISVSGDDGGWHLKIDCPY